MSMVKMPCICFGVSRCLRVIEGEVWVIGRMREMGRMGKITCKVGILLPIPPKSCPAINVHYPMPKNEQPPTKNEQPQSTTQQRFNKFVTRKRPQVFDAFTRADKADG